jgi:hypothetical protein
MATWSKFHRFVMETVARSLTLTCGQIIVKDFYRVQRQYNARMHAVAATGGICYCIAFADGNVVSLWLCGRRRSKTTPWTLTYTRRPSDARQKYPVKAEAVRGLSQCFEAIEDAKRLCEGSGEEDMRKK